MHLGEEVTQRLRDTWWRTLLNMDPDGVVALVAAIARGYSEPAPRGLHRTPRAVRRAARGRTPASPPARRAGRRVLHPPVPFKRSAPRWSPPTRPASPHGWCAAKFPCGFAPRHRPRLEQRAEIPHVAPGPDGKTWWTLVVWTPHGRSDEERTPPHDPQKSGSTCRDARGR